MIFLTSFMPHKYDLMQVYEDVWTIYAKYHLTKESFKISLVTFTALPKGVLCLYAFIFLILF